MTTNATKGFWANMQKPIVGLSPMDGVTDIAYREVQASLGKPDLIYTEFIPVEGIVRMAERLLRDFWYSNAETPVVAQIYGNTPALFYSSAQLVCELGFDGVDLNMGCPAKSVVHRGCGAALIRTPDLARELVLAARQGVEDWAVSGINWQRWPEISGAKARRELETFLAEAQALDLCPRSHFAQHGSLSSGGSAPIPVSVKTRIGFIEAGVESWLGELVKAEPVAVALHGRTLKQLYTGQADWQQIALGAHILHDNGILALGNGDVDGVESFHGKLAQSGVDGILVGRATYGNPWIFQQIKANNPQKPTWADVKQAMLLHASLLERYKPDAFVQVRKNLAWYVKGIPDAAALRAQLVKVNSFAEVEQIVASLPV